MSSDLIINDSVVVGLQNVAVSDETPTDGYVLTYDATGDGYWGPKPIPTSGGLRKEYFTSSGTWTCPEGVTNILVIAAGGGGGGQAGSGAGISYGGGGSIQQTSYVSVTPGLTYNINIGAGGTGGIGNSSGSAGNSGNNGGSTTLTYSSSTLFSASGAAGGGFASKGNNISNLNTIYYVSPLFFIAGAGGGADGSTPLSGNKNYLDIYAGGSPGTTSISFGGSGGGAGPQGNGGNGGNGTSTNGTNGQSAGSNTAAGAGAGGNYQETYTGGNGGNGGSGYLYIIY